jgi:hypothetical protein
MERFNYICSKNSSSRVLQKEGSNNFMEFQDLRCEMGQELMNFTQVMKEIKMILSHGTVLGIRGR